MNALEACERARAAWERSQPQLFLELFPDGGLDEREARRLPLVEPVAFAADPTGGSHPGSGLTVGAEPCRGKPVELTAPSSGIGSAAALAASPAGSAPLSTTTEAGANHRSVTRARLQKGA